MPLESIYISDDFCKLKKEEQDLIIENLFKEYPDIPQELKAEIEKKIIKLKIGQFFDSNINDIVKKFRKKTKKN